MKTLEQLEEDYQSALDGRNSGDISDASAALEEYHARASERLLRANLERLAERWKLKLPEPEEANRDRLMDGLYEGLDCAISELRRTLSGETPPEPGMEWPASEEVGGK